MRHDNIPYLVLAARFLFVAVFVLAGCTGRPVEVVGLADTTDAPELDQERPSFWDPIPMSPSTTVPERIADEYWHGQFVRVNNEIAATEDSHLVFFGDSITKGWTLLSAVGQPVWQERYAPLNAINMGNSGDITPVMLYRVTHGNLDFVPGQQPRVAVLLCGTNNFGVMQSDGGRVRWDLGPDCPPEDVANGARAIAQVFRRQLPETRVILLGVLPVRNQAKQANVQATNAINASLGYNDDEVVYLDLQDRFTQDDGSLNDALYTDGTHLTEAGYRVWADALDPVIDAMMQVPPLDPVRIMLIGDSVTQGADSATSYRRYLDGMLRRQGIVFDFVGSRRGHGEDAAPPESYEFDPDHEGHWGAEIQVLSESLRGALSMHTPDIAVINVGADGILRGDILGNQLAEHIVPYLDAMVSALRSDNERVGIVLTQITPVPGQEQAVAELNRAVLAYAAANHTATSPIVVADLHTGFDAQAGLALDGYLPSAAGAQDMARIYAVAIQRLLAAQE